MKLLDIYIICIFFSGIELFLKVKGLRESGRYIVADMGHNGWVPFLGIGLRTGVQSVACILKTMIKPMCVRF